MLTKLHTRKERAKRVVVAAVVVVFAGVGGGAGVGNMI